MTLPNFLLIGAPKSGTSSLYHYLSQHPQIFMSPEKEPHFFYLKDQEVSFKGPGDMLRFRNAITNLEKYEKLFINVKDEKAIGEASTTYLRSPRACNNIKNYIPQARLIVILRNPIEAAYASFFHLQREGDETTADFKKALSLEDSRAENNWENIWHYRNRGKYFSQLSMYFETFPRSSIKIYLYEDLIADPASVLQSMFSFLGVDSRFVPELSQKYNVSGKPKSSLMNKLIKKDSIYKKVFQLITPESFRKNLSSKLLDWNFGDYTKPQMNNSCKQILIESYKEDILKLQDLLQRDLSSWLYL